jgi:prevent-host-death family protein
MLTLKKISALKMRQNLGEIMNEVALRNDQYVIERSGKPLAAIVPVWQLEQWFKQREAFFQRIKAMQKKSKQFPAEKIEREITTAVRAVRSRAVKNRQKKRI